MEKEPNVEQPSVESQRTYASLRDNDATVVSILGTKKKYRIRWLKNGQIDRLSRLLIRKGKTDNEDGTKDSPLDAIIEDSKLACKAAAIYILDGYWKLKFGRKKPSVPFKNSLRFSVRRRKSQTVAPDAP